MLRRLFLLTGMLLLIAAFSPLLTMACTGRPYSSEIENIDKYDLWVRATVIDRDDRGYNAVLYVEDYYKGEGPRVLVVKRHLPALQSVLTRGYSNGCLGNGGGQEYRRGTSGYFGLKPNDDGTYTDWHFGSAQYYAWDGVVHYLEDHDWHEIKEEDFVAKLLKIGRRDSPIEPAFEEVQRYPLMRYLMITTEKGARFQVNPDRSVMAVPADAPIAMSPDGAHWAHRLYEDTLGFGRPFQQQGKESVSYFTEVPGREVRFSNDSNMVAVWHASELSIYMFRIRGHNYRGGTMSMDRIATVDLNATSGMAPRVMWSADSTTLVWQEESGIWRWNLYEEEQPTLIVAEDDCHLIDVSSHGRYLRYGTALGWTLHDSRTGESYANALAAPGESILVFINREDEPIPSWRDSIICAPPLTQNCALYIDTVVQPVEMHVYPRMVGSFGLLFCEYDGLCDDRRYSWNPSAPWHWFYWDEPEMDQKPWRQFAYDPFYDRKAILYGDYRIDLETWIDMLIKASDDFAIERQLDSLDLEGIVDSPIASIEWGQPIFYDTFMLTATEYMPRTVTIAGGGSPTQNDINVN